MNEVLQLTSATIMASVSSVGIVVNFYVFSALVKRKHHLSVFYKLCISKTICNLITCLAFLVWSAPCTFIGIYYLPHWANVFWGQLAGWGAYVTGIAIQVCLSLNRFTVTYFPFSSNGRFFNIENCLASLVLLFLLATFYGFPEGCGYIYSIEIVSWLPEDSECALTHADQIFYFILTVAFVSNSSNLATFLKLVKATKIQRGAMNQEHRTRRSRLMFAQSVTQDCLHVIDMLACQVIYKFNDALWFQFICMSVVWLTIHVFDGFVMLIYNRDIHPMWWKRRSMGSRMVSINISSKVV